MLQLVGRDCVICNDRISSTLDAEFCESCGNPVHRSCREKFQKPEGQDSSRCAQCGGDPQDAPVEQAPPAEFKAEYGAYGLGAIILLSILALMIWQVVVWTGGDSSPESASENQSSADADAAKKNGNPIVEIETNMGTIKAELYSDKAPKTVENFVDLVDQEFYDGIIFHRVIDGFMIQTGDPLGQGIGGRTSKGLPAKVLTDEFHDDLRHDKPGVLSMANSGPNTGDTQFFITTVPTPHLDEKHAIFGQVIEGMDIVHKIGKVQTAGQNRPLMEIKMVRVRMVDEK